MIDETGFSVTRLFKNLLKYIIILIVISMLYNTYFSKQNMRLSLNLINLVNGSTTLENIDMKFSLTEILKYELGLIDSIKEKDENEISEEIEILLDDDDIETEVAITAVPENFSDEYSGVKIKNETDFDLSQAAIDKMEEPQLSRNVIIFNTHSSESYTPTDENNYEATGNYRTKDNNYNVTKVATTLTKYLQDFKFNVIQDTTLHDAQYSGSYDKSYKTVENITSKNKNYELIFDIHRDALGSDANYAPTVKIGEEEVAQLMFVIGTNGGGLDHSDWQQNLKVAIKIQEEAEKLYPGLFKPIIVRNSRYNQNLGLGASIIEVGATGNTLEQAEASMKYLSIVLDKVF